MFLQKLQIKNFRSIRDLELHFNKGLNIIIGENNSGKSAIIDALRICLSYGKQWRDIGIRNAEDFHLDVTEITETFEPIEFHLFFKVEAPEDRHNFNSMVVQGDDPAEQNIQIHFRYYLEENVSGSKVLRWSAWGGAIEGQVIKPEEAQLIYFSYLAALRNAEQELRPYAKENKVISLFREMTKYQVENGGQPIDKELNADSKKELARKLESVIHDEDWSGLIKSGEKLVNEHLEKADINKKESRIHLKLLEYDYNNIIKGLLLRKPAYQDALLGDDLTRQRYFDVSQNGLGENNLIYASAVLGDLKNRRIEKKEHYYALLIEEPEAHLHPQRQNTFFNYLNNLKELEVQVFITSHSPTLTAKADLNNLIILQKQENSISSFRFNNSILSDANKSYLRKFVDVTKSQLFFANGSILVEGISEALLLPILARSISENYDLDKNGIELVNIDGVAFEPFARLYNSGDLVKRLPSRCSLITDNDKSLISAANFIDAGIGVTKEIAHGIFKQLLHTDLINRDNRIVNFEPGTPLVLAEFSAHEVHVRQVLSQLSNRISDRANKAQALQSGNLRTYLGELTFEYELMVQGEFNYKIIRTLYKQLHPQTELPQSGDLNKRALIVLEKINTNKDKSQLAEYLAHFLETRPLTRARFIVPSYLRNAVIWVVDGQ